jgi:hypothetical protein
MALGNYRGFAKRQSIELRPITVVLGRNNAGKSALVRAPVILGTGFTTRSSEPLDVDQLGEDMLGSFTDLIHGSRVHRGSIDVELGVQARDDLLLVKATIQHIADHHTQVVSELELLVNGRPVCRLEWELSDPTATPHYTVEAGDQTWTGVPVEFQGLLPVEGLPGGLANRPRLTMVDPPSVTETFILLRAHYPAIRYLGPFRDRPHRRYRLPGRMGSEVGIAGENAAGILASDLARAGGGLLRQVNTDLAEHLPGWWLDVVERGGVWSVVLTSTQDEGVQVNLADTGTGVAQALPIFVQRAIDLHQRHSQAVLEVVEQPELHLHPAAHAMLADLYLAAVKRTSTRFLIETHSETLLLRLRRRIAEGLDPSTVAVYFVDRDGGESTARRIHIDPDGNLDHWPAGVFAEDYEETRKLAVAQRQRRSAADAR